MLNLRNPLGRRIDVTLSADVSSGAIKEEKGIVGIPLEHALNGSTVVFLQEGIVTLTLSIGGTLAQGTFLYWDVGAGAVSIGANAQDIELGQILGSDPDGGSSVYLVRLNIGYPRAAAGSDQREA